jgi:hypothetical protein
MKFQNPAVAALFSMVGDQDTKIDIPGVYKGNLSEVSDADVIAKMIERKSNLVVANTSTEKTAEKSPTPKTTETPSTTK